MSTICCKGQAAAAGACVARGIRRAAVWISSGCSLACVALGSAWAGLAPKDTTAAPIAGGDCRQGTCHKVAPETAATAMTDAAPAKAHRSLDRRMAWCSARCLAGARFKSLIRKDVELSPAAERMAAKAALYRPGCGWDGVSAVAGGATASALGCPTTTGMNLGPVDFVAFAGAWASSMRLRCSFQRANSSAICAGERLLISNEIKSFAGCLTAPL